ncbi:MAG TPA: galactokinase family protein [Ktedonobacterales bacterium]
MMKEKKECCVSAPGRVCLAGEKLDWTGGSAIVCAVEDLRVYVRARASAEPDVTTVISTAPFDASDRFDAHDPGSLADGPLRYVRAVFLELASRRLPPDNVAIEIRSTLPAAAGLSSSAALCVAVAGALDEYHSFGLSPEAICDIAFRAEARWLLTGCGQMDQYASGLGGVHYIDCATEPPAEIERLRLQDGLAIVVGDTQTRRSAGTVIGGMRERLAQGDEAARAYITSTQQEVHHLRGMLRQTDLDLAAVGALLDRCHEYARDLARVSTPELDRCVQTARDAGALGAKVTGAGNGGCMFALAWREQAEQVARAINSAGGVTYITLVTTTGLRVEDPALFNANVTASTSSGGSE